MTRITRALLGALLVLAFAMPAHAQWVDDWFASSTTTSAGGFQGQQRGYYSLGGFQGRWRMTNDYLVSAQAPRLKLSCGGLDVFGGGMSFLDPEFLVEKFERIIQAAPAFAFQLALSHMCKDCAAKLNELEQMANQLNGIQVNDCRMAKRIATVLVDGDPKNLMDDIADEAGLKSVGDNLRKNWRSFISASGNAGGAPPDDMKTLVDGCPTAFKRIFTDGSVLENTADQMGLSDYVPLMRALVGDAIVTRTATSFQIERLDGCPISEDRDGVDPLSGELMKRDVGGACESAGERRVIDIIQARLEGVRDRMRAGQALTAADQAFIDEAPLPVYKALRDSMIDGDSSDDLILLLREPLAVAYGHKILDDLLKAGSVVLKKANEVEMNAATAPGAAQCSVQGVAGATTHIKQLLVKSAEQRDRLHATYQKKLAEFLANVEAGQALVEMRKRALSGQAVALKR
jgi:conjugative transfer pilus assembly protein TraH